MKKVYGYIRVSTVKQGTGVSLQEQQEAIVRYAEKHELTIIEWFKELETAAKQGRPLFSKMMKLLQSGKASGVIIHKIDRSARNLKDWAALGDLIDKGVDVHFAHESLDMDTRGGRLAADIQAVIASDYIRNLRDEAKKGLYGRLKQGIYPFNAPTGYLNNGRGQLKTIDPIQGPLVCKIFQLYGSERYSLDALTKVAKELGLKNLNGRFISKTGMSQILNNPFYAGVLKVKGKTFPGMHEPLISSTLYSKVQQVLSGKTNSKQVKHDFLFRKLVKCSDCGYTLTGEKQKGYVYYRCHSKECSISGIREELIERSLIKCLEQIELCPDESQMINDLLQEAHKNWSETQTGIENSLRLQEGRVSQKLARLTDAYIDNTIEKSVFEEKKEMLIIELQGLRHKTSQVSGQKNVIFKKARKYFELAKSLKKSYIIGVLDEKRELLKITTSNLKIEGKKLVITMKSPFQEIANRSFFLSSALERDRLRISTPEYVDSGNFPPKVVDKENLRESMQELLNQVLQYFEVHNNEADETII